MNLSSNDDDSGTCSTRCLNNFCNGDSIGSTPEEVFPNLPSAISTKYNLNLKNVNKLIVNDMNHVSISERDQAYEDVHGVRNRVEENDELISYSLNQMEEEVSKIKMKFTPYLIAEEMSKDFVQDRKFRLKFLRSSRFDPVVAAERLVRFFELKLELFGEEKLTKTITISDLDEEDLFCLMAGKYQLLPYRDRSGRAVICFFFRTDFPTKNVNAMVRSNWYFLMSVMEDEETQRRGFTSIYYMLSDIEGQTKLDPHRQEFSRRVGQFCHALPTNNTCTHWCFNKSNIIALSYIFIKRVNSRTRTRMRIHEGSDAECQFSLMTYGIPLHAFPMTSSGNVKVDNHLKWIQRRRIVDSTIVNGTVCNIIDLPSKYDVLLGRGKPIQNSTGNEHLREILKDYCSQYQKAAKGEKSKVVALVVDVVKKYPARFLTLNKNVGGWVEVPDDIAIQKVSATFRTVIANESSGRSKKNVMVTDHDRKRIKF